MVEDIKWIGEKILWEIAVRTYYPPWMLGNRLQQWWYNKNSLLQEWLVLRLEISIRKEEVPMPKLPFICQQANMVERVTQMWDDSGYNSWIEIRLKNGQTISIEFEGTIEINSSVADGMRKRKWGGMSANMVSLVEETFTQRMG